MFKKLMIRIRKRTFANNVLLQCNNFLSEFLESDNNNEARKEIQETIGNHCFDIIRKKGSQEINDFRKHMIEKILGIVQSDDPIVSMRKELIHTIHSDILNHTFFIEKFANRRKELYESLNKYMDNAEIVNCDDATSVMFILSEAESVILRLLQHQYFEKTGKDDWFSAYSNAYRSYTEQLFELILAKKDGKDFSVNGVLFPAFKKAIEAFQKTLIGEVIS